MSGIKTSAEYRAGMSASRQSALATVEGEIDEVQEILTESKGGDASLEHRVHVLEGQINNLEQVTFNENNHLLAADAPAFVTGDGEAYEIGWTPQKHGVLSNISVSIRAYSFPYPLTVSYDDQANKIIVALETELVDDVLTITSFAKDVVSAINFDPICSEYVQCVGEDDSTPIVEEEYQGTGGYDGKVCAIGNMFTDGSNLYIAKRELDGTDNVLSDFTVVALNTLPRIAELLDIMPSSGDGDAELTAASLQMLFVEGLAGTILPGDTVAVGGKTYTFADPSLQRGTAILSIATVNNGDTITIDAVTYTMKTALSDPAVANEILIGGSASDTLNNIVAAITGTDGVGDKFSTGTVPNDDVTAEKVSTTVVVTNKLYGSIAIPVSATGGCSWNGSATAGGVAFGANKIMSVTNDNAGSCTNLANAINGTGYPGTTEGWDTETNEVVSAEVTTEPKGMTFTALASGSDGNDLSFDYDFAEAEVDIGEGFTGGSECTPGLPGKIIYQEGKAWIATKLCTITDGSGWLPIHTPE